MFFRPLSRKSLKSGVSARKFLIPKIDPGLQIISFDEESISTVKDGWPSSLISTLLLGGLRAEHKSDELIQALKNVVKEDRRGREIVSNYGESLNSAKGATLIGYWQSADYFPNSWHFFHSILTEPPKAPTILGRLAARISDEDPICVHIRRGDYISSKKARQLFPTLPANYFETAVARLIEEENTNDIWIFSDDIDYCRRELRFPDHLRLSVFAPGSFGLSDLDQLKVMSLCRRFVISNSTFSWWAAWGSNASRVVFPPVWSTQASMPSLGERLPAWTEGDLQR